MRVPERERSQAGDYPSENRTRLRPGATDYPSALGRCSESVTMEGGRRAMTTITDQDTQLGNGIIERNTSAGIINQGALPDSS